VKPWLDTFLSILVKSIFLFAVRQLMKYVALPNTTRVTISKWDADSATMAEDAPLIHLINN
jgi:hypothetical protein